MAVKLRHWFVAAFAACAAPAFAEAPAEIHPALFVARDADSTLYLFGTVHVRPTGAEWADDSVRAALSEADEVWTELPIGTDTEAEMLSVMPELGYDSVKPLSAWLSADEQARLLTLTRRLGLPDGALERMRPWLAGLVLSQAPLMRAGFNPQSGVDRAVDAYADAQGKRMRAFESVREQLGFFATLPDALQHEMLLEAIDDNDDSLAEFTALSQAWEAGDLSLVEQFVVRELRLEYPHLYDVLIARRNVAWVETLSAELAGSGVDFVAVGAGHMVGEDGLVAMLRARGVSVERVVSPEESALR
jgi:uncharacterized protein